MAIIKKLLEATTNVIKSWTLKNIVPLITHMPHDAWAERADAGNPCHAQLMLAEWTSEILSLSLSVIENSVQNPIQHSKLLL